MNIYFQTGEFIGHQSFLETYGNLIGIVVATIVSWTIFYFEKKRDENKELARLEDLRKYLRKAIHDLNEPIDEQKQDLIRIVKILLEKKHDPFARILYSNLNAENIKWISRGDLYNIINRNAINMKKLNDELSYLDFVNPHLYESFKYAITDTRVYIERLLKIRRAVSNIWRKMKAEYETSKKTNVYLQKSPFYIEFEKLYAQWLTSKDRFQPVNVWKYLLRPLAAECAKYEFEQDALNVLVLIEEYNVVYNHVRSRMRLSRRNFMFSYRRLKKCQRHLKEISESL